MKRVKGFFENVITNKTSEYNNVYNSRFRYNKMIDEIKTLGLPEDKILEVLKVVEKYQK